jgi:catalase
MGPHCLVDEIGDWVRRGPATFQLMLQVPDQGDQIDHPSIAWPETRKNAELETIAITKATTESHPTDKQLLPGAVVRGIEARDPMIAIRTAAYPISFERRFKPQ